MLSLFPDLPTSWAILTLIFTALLSYFLGCWNGAVIVSKYVLHDDIRNHGSGNAGLTNFYRCFGGKLTFLVIALDVVKTLLAVWFSVVIFSATMIDVPIEVRYWAGLFCMLGHMFPVTFHFRGGKGILSGGTLVFTLDWKIALAVWLVFLLAVFLTRLVSLGSCGTGVMFPIASTLVYQSLWVFLLSLMVGLLILWQHRANLRRLIAGKETRFAPRGKKKEVGKP